MSELFLSQLFLSRLLLSQLFLSQRLLSPGGCSWRGQRGDFEWEREADDFHDRESNLPTSSGWDQADVEGEVPDEVEHPGEHFRGSGRGSTKTGGGAGESIGSDQLWADTLVGLSTGGSNVWRCRRSHRLPRFRHRLRRLTWLQVLLIAFPQKRLIEIVHALKSGVLYCENLRCVDQIPQNLAKNFKRESKGLS